MDRLLDGDSSHSGRRGRGSGTSLAGFPDDAFPDDGGSGRPFDALGVGHNTYLKKWETKVGTRTAVFCCNRPPTKKRGSIVTVGSGPRPRNFANGKLCHPKKHTFTQTVSSQTFQKTRQLQGKPRRTLPNHNFLQHREEKSRRAQRDKRGRFNREHLDLIVTSLGL